MLIRGLFALLCCLLASPALAITFDTVNTGEGTTSATTGSLAVAADANICIICCITRESAGAVVQAASAAFGGQAATHLAGGSNSGLVVRADVFYLLAPPTGSQTGTCTGGAGTDFTVVGAMTFKGVAQSSTFGTPVVSPGASSAAMDVNSIGSAVGEMGVLCGAIRDNTTTATADATAPVSTERFEDPHATSTSVIGVGYTEDGAVTSIDMRVDLSETKQWAATGVSMRPAAARRRPIAPMFFP